MSAINPKDVVARSIAVTRKLAMSQFVGQNVPVGPEFLAAGILKSLPNGVECLRSCGFDHLIPCLASIPDASVSDLDKLPPVTLSDELDQLLKGKLSGYMGGVLSADDALRMLLAIPGVPDRLASFPQSGAKVPAPIIGTRELMARITKMIQYGYGLAQTYYSAKSETGLSDFAAEKIPSAFLRTCEDYRKQRDAVRALMYSGPRGRRLSVFERYMRTYGPLVSDVATAVMVNEFTPYVRSGQFALVRDIAYAIAPYDYHRIAGDVIGAVQTLKQADLVRIYPEPEHCQMCSAVLPAEPLISDFAQYLGESTDSSFMPGDWV
jgi:hypothetical protein